MVTHFDNISQRLSSETEDVPTRIQWIEDHFAKTR